jgi:hypothetical protein
MDAGWTRWVLEQYGFEIVPIRPEDLRTAIGARVDTIILADDARIPVETSGGGTRGEGGTRGSTGAAPTQATAGQGRGGTRVVRPEHAYALAAADLQGLEAFVRNGGTIVCFNSATRFAIQQFKLPVKNVAEGLRPGEFFLRGSIVEVQANTSHPVMTGMPPRSAVFVDGSPVFETQPGFQGTVLASYTEKGSPLLSGYLIGEKVLSGRAAALDVELDRGHVLLFGFRPQWRAQSFGTFKVVFNSIVLGGR